MGSIVRPLSHSLSLEAIDVKYLLNTFAIASLNNITIYYKKGCILTIGNKNIMKGKSESDSETTRLAAKQGYSVSDTEES